MLELLVCSVLTILPDYLYRRFAQGKRLGREITLFSVWYELRWGIVGCLVLTLSLITAIFYFHPSTTNAAAFFRTVTILPEQGGRVAEVFVRSGERVEAGQPLFRLDDSTQAAQAESARRRIAEADAALRVARSDLIRADGQIAQARGAFEQARDALDTRLELQQRNPDAVAQREIDRLRNAVEGAQGALDAAMAQKDTLQTQIDALLPAQRASAEAALAEAQVALDKTTIYAGVDGVLEQFVLRPGDFVSPVLRPAGILIPEASERRSVQAGFNQIEAQVLKVGMIAEITCPAIPFTVIPMVVTDVQDAIASGQFRPTDFLIDLSGARQPGTLLAFLEPLHEGGIDALPPGASCIANAYTSNHDRLDDPDLSTAQWLGLHAIDAIGIVHAAMLRLQALLLPVRTLVLSGAH